MFKLDKTTINVSKVSHLIKKIRNHMKLRPGRMPSKYTKYTVLSNAKNASYNQKENTFGSYTSGMEYYEMIHFILKL